MLESDDEEVGLGINGLVEVIAREQMAML